MKFKPQLLPTTVCLILFLLLIYLGMWQWQRYQFKKAVLKHYHLALSQLPISLAALANKSDKQFQHVQMQGQFLNKNFLLQNRYSNDKIGFEVITPFHIKGQQNLFLVDRGWVPMLQNMQAAPLPAIAQTQIVTGILRYPDHVMVMLGQNILDTLRWPMQMQKIDLLELQAVLKSPLYPFVIYMDKNNDNGFVREWQPITVLPERHFGYMIQWFVMAVVLLVAYVALSCKG